MPGQGAAPDFLDIAQIQSPHGVAGEVRARILTDFPQRFARLKTVYLGEEAAPFRLQRSRLSGPEVILKFAGVDTPEAAADLRFKVVRIRAADAVVLPPGAYFHHQIIGLQAVTAGGEELGRVTGILATGGNDVYVVEGEAGEYLIPAIAEVVREVDLAAQRLVVQLMEGMEPRPPVRRRAERRTPRARATPPAARGGPEQSEPPPDGSPAAANADPLP